MTEFYETRARRLRVGDNIRLAEDHYSKILSINVAEDHLIVGGEFNKTAVALRINTLDRTEIFVHPGQIFGVKRDRAPSKSLQWLYATIVSHAGGFGV